jgi:DHA2 family multidrug resistance protein
MQAQDMLTGMTAMMDERGLMDPDGAAHKAFGMILRRDAMVLAFGDGFFFLAAGCAVASILGFLATPAKVKAAPGGDGGH